MWQNCSFSGEDASWSGFDNLLKNVFHSSNGNVQLRLEYNGKLYDIAGSVRLDQQLTLWISKPGLLRKIKKS